MSVLSAALPGLERTATSAPRSGGKAARRHEYPGRTAQADLEVGITRWICRPAVGQATSELALPTWPHAPTDAPTDAPTGGPGRGQFRLINKGRGAKVD